MIDKDELKPQPAASDPAPAAELARRLIDGDAAPDELAGADRLALAWALKDACYTAWSSEPQRAAKAATALRRLSDTALSDTINSDRDSANPLAREIGALAAWTAGIAHITRGQMAAATQCFDHAAEIFRGLGQLGHAAQTQVPKIMALAMLGRYDDAAECAEHAQREFVALGDMRGAGKVSLNLGALHERRGAYALSARHSREASVLLARVGDHEFSVTADFNMANALTSMGDFDEALRIYARARMRASTHGFPVLETLVDEAVALLQLARGRYREALAGFESARRHYEQLAMPHHLAIAEKQLAYAYLELRLLPEALTLFDQVLSRFQGLNVPDEQAWTLAQRGRVQVLLERPTQAMESFEQAAVLFAAQGIGVGEAAVTLALAELALARDDSGTALALAAQARRGFVAADMVDGRLRADVVRANALLRAGGVKQARALFDATLDVACKLQLLTVQVRCLTGQGLAALALGDPSSAQSAFNAAVELFEDQRRALPGDELRCAFLTDHLRPYQELLRMALRAHARTPSPEFSAEVLLQLDRFRARSLGERLTQGSEFEDNASTQGLRDRLNWLYRRVQRLDDEGESSAALTDELRRTELQLLEGARRVRLAAPMPEPTKGNDDHVNVETLQRLLGDEDALVEYGVLDDELFACIVTPDGAIVRRELARWSDLLAAAQSARFQIETLRHGAAPVAQHLDHLTRRARKRMAQLYALLWAPLRDLLAPFKKIIVVPHAQLAMLPFGALHDGKKFLAESLELATAPSARIALYGLLRHAAVPARALVLGESASQPHAEHEARFVASMFPHCAVFTGEQATVDALHANAEQADVIHFACHAQFRSDNPMFSALHLHDGALTVESVEKLKLRPGIVVLSACETGLAESGSGDEMIGLVRAFLVAGAARVVASLWPVDDEIAAAFMSHFYSALCRGSSPSKALLLSQNAVMKQHAHPFYWAGFTLYGGW